MVKRFTLCTILTFALAVTITWAETYSGSISHGDGLEGAEIWSTATIQVTAVSIMSSSSSSPASSTSSAGRKRGDHGVEGVGPTDIHLLWAIRR